MKYEIHELANLFPMLNEQEYERLRDDIKKNGLLNPIVLFEERILDGRNRSLVCEELGIEIKTVEYMGDDPFGYVMSTNLHRRHLGESQRAMVAARIANMRQGERTDLEPSEIFPKVSQKDAAKMFGISDKLLRGAKKIIEEGTPEQIESVQKGQKTVSTILKEINKKKTPESTDKKEKTETTTQQEEAPGKEPGEQPPLPETSYQTKTSSVETTTAPQPDDDAAEDIVRSWLDSPGRVKRMLDIYEEKLAFDKDKQVFYKSIKQWLGMRIKV